MKLIKIADDNFVITTGSNSNIESGDFYFCQGEIWKRMPSSNVIKIGSEKITHSTKETGLKTSKEWQDEFPDMKVIDPDGWDRNDYDWSWGKEQISFDEYSKRLMKSTCVGDPKNFPTKPRVRPLDLLEIKTLIGEVSNLDKACKRVIDFYPQKNQGYDADKASKGFVLGYTTCLDDNKDKQFTEQNLKDAAEHMRLICNDMRDYGTTHRTMEKFFKSLGLRSEWEVQFGEYGILSLKK